MSSIRVTVWNEYLHELEDAQIGAVYPEGIHGCIRQFVAEAGYPVRTATLVQEEHGLTKEVLEQTDVLIWWGHMAHHRVSDEVAARVQDRVNAGMGLIVLHSAHASKVFERLCGTPTGMLRWRHEGEKEILWVVEPLHPIAQGIPDHIVLEREEMYGERFNIPAPDELIFLGWFEGGEVFRSGCCFHRGRGRIFYFQPGHESFPTYHHKDIQRIILNAIEWAAPRGPVGYVGEEYTKQPNTPIVPLKR